MGVVIGRIAFVLCLAGCDFVLGLRDYTLVACGPILVCDGTQGYCRHSVSDVGGEPDTWSCEPFPSCGGQTGCSCVLKTPCGAFCSADASNNVTVTCPGG